MSQCNAAINLVRAKRNREAFAHAPVLILTMFPKWLENETLKKLDELEEKCVLLTK